jgi:pSer/pThr/pTyr-binding forkhead associated (FHA) protein
LHVVINDPLVSREHCLLELKPEGLFLEDLHSANGTLVNEQRITRVLLHPGDKIRLGLSEIILEQVPEKGEVLPAPPAQSPDPGLKQRDREAAEPSKEAEPEKSKTLMEECQPSQDQTKPWDLYSSGFPNQEPLFLVSHPDAEN